MKVAVSGADGFLGLHILSLFKRDAEYDVVAITLFPQKIRDRFFDWSDLHIVPAQYEDILHSNELENVDIYISCAFPRAADSKQMGCGLDFVYDALLLMLNKGCKAVVNISSQSVYDPRRKFPAKETDSVALTSAYAVAKYCMELSVAKMCAQRDVPYVNVRMASLIGPGFDQRFVNKMVKSAVNNAVVSYVEGKSKHAFLDVRDAADALGRITQSMDSLCHTVNLGPNRSYSTQEIAHRVATIVAKKTGRDVCLESIGQETNYTCSEIDVSRLQGAIGLIAKTEIDQSITDIYINVLGDRQYENNRFK